MKTWCCGLLFSVLAAFAWAKPAEKTENVELRMPNVRPQKPDTYLCQPMKMSKTAKYITGFVPHGNMSVAHHILLYGCKEPGHTDKTWNCGEMSSSGQMDKTYPMGPTCKSGFAIVYAWAMDAPALTLPPGVGFKVGGDSDIKWLVLQVHYKNVKPFLPPKNGTDKSGITMKQTTTPQPKLAGVYLSVTGGMLPAKSTVYMEVACSYNEPLVLHPFAFRVHAHTHGQVTAGYRVRNNKWTEIGRESPQKPQMFYNVTTPGIDVKQGDILAARCTMVNKENRDIMIGATQNDEMCNFYMMFWVKGDKLPVERECQSDGFPNWGFSHMSGLDVSKIPSTASVMPGSKLMLKATAMINQVEKQMEETDKEMEDDIEDFLASLNARDEEEEINDQIGFQRDTRRDMFRDDVRERDLRDDVRERDLNQYEDINPYDLYNNF